MLKHSLDEEGIEKLNLFLRRFDQLKRTRFFSDPQLKNIGYQIRGDRADDGFRIGLSIKVPDDDTVKSFLLSFRVFYMKDEPTYFYSVGNLLHKKVSDQTVRGDIAAIRETYSKALNHGAISFTFQDKKYSPQGIIDLWFNAVYFHTDVNKVKELDVILKSPTANLFYFLLVDTVVTLTNAITELKGIIAWLLSDDRTAGENE